MLGELRRNVLPPWQALDPSSSGISGYSKAGGHGLGLALWSREVRSTGSPLGQDVPLLKSEPPCQTIAGTVGVLGVSLSPCLWSIAHRWFWKSSRLENSHWGNSHLEADTADPHGHGVHTCRFAYSLRGAHIF